MYLNNRLERIKVIIELLNQGSNLSTPKLVERFGVSKKIIQTDFKGECKSNCVNLKN